MVAVPGLPEPVVHVPTPTPAMVAVPPGRVTQLTVWFGPPFIDGPVTVTDAVIEQFVASVTVTIYVPTERPVIVDGPVRLSCVTPLDQWKVQGLYKPVGVAVAVPALALAQVAGVEVIVGGQHEPTAYRFVIGSLAQATLVHDPDSPSPEVAILTPRLLFGVHTILVVIVKQNFHEHVFKASLSP